MNIILDYVYRLITSPLSAMEEITGGEKLKVGGIIWLFVIFLITLSSFRTGPGIVTEFIGMVISLGIILLFHSAIIDYFSGLLGGKGTARGITSGFMSASLPYAFSVFFTLLENFGLEGINGIGLFFISLWCFILDILAIRANYGFSNGKAFLIGISPFILGLVLTLAILVLGVVSALAGLADMQQIEGLMESI